MSVIFFMKINFFCGFMRHVCAESEDFPENPIDDWMISIQYDSLKDLLQNTHQEESSSHLAEDSLLWKLQKQNADREKTEQICISDLQIIEEVDS